MTTGEFRGCEQLGIARAAYWKDRPSHHSSTDKARTELQAMAGEILARRVMGQPYPGFNWMVRAGKVPDVLHYNVKTLRSAEFDLFVHPDSDRRQSFTHYLAVLWLGGRRAYILGEIEKHRAHEVATMNRKVPTPNPSLAWALMDRYTGPLVQAAPWTFEELMQ